MDDFVVTCPYFTRKSGIRTKDKVLHPLFRTFAESLSCKDQRALFSELPFASIIGNLPEITLQYLWIAATFQRMEIKSSFQASIYKLICVPLNHAVNSSWFQLNLEIKKDSQEILLLYTHPKLFPEGHVRKLRLCGYSFENCPLWR